MIPGIVLNDDGARSSGRSADPAETLETGPRTTAHTVFRVVIAGGLLLLTTFTPWVFGGMNTWWQTLIGWSLVGLVVAAATELCLFRSILRLPTLLVPLLLAALIGLGQLILLPSSILDWLSPRAATLWSIDDLPIASTTIPTEATAPLSLYPASTRHDTSRLVLAALVFLLASRYLISATAQWWMWTTMLLNGIALAVFGILQQLTWNGRLYWTVEPPYMTTAFGPYVNHNNAAGFLNMCLAGAIPLVLFEPALTRARGIPSAGARWRGTVVPWIGVAALATVAAGVAASLSRGAFLAMAVSGAATLVALLLRQRRIAPAGKAILALLAGAALLSAAGVSESVQSRLATLLDQKALQNERLEHWREASTVIPDFLWTGTGLGTYRHVYPLYRTGPHEELYYHAENQYLEALVEAGVPGLVLLLAALGLSLAAAVRLLQSDVDPRHAGFALAGLFVLLTQALHSGLDFGLYLPANMLMLALVAGAVAGRAGLYEVAGRPRRWIALTDARSFGMRAAFGVALLVQCVLPLAEARGAQEVSRLRAGVRADSEADLSTADREVALRRLSDAADSARPDLELQTSLARAWIDLYALRGAARLRENESGAFSDAALRDMLSTARLHDAVAELISRDDLSAADSLRRDPLIAETLHPALRHLVEARLACPLSQWVQFRIGELTVLRRAPADVRVLDAFESFAWRRADLMYSAGRLHLAAGRNESAFRAWRASLAASDQFESAILAAVLPQHDFKTVLERLLPPSPRYLVSLARNRYDGKAKADERHALLEAAERLLNVAQVSPAESHHLRASIHALRDEIPKAAHEYERALAMAGSRSDWRYEYAGFLMRSGKRRAALEQASLCAQSDPSNVAYRSLYLSLSQNLEPPQGGGSVAED